MQPTFNNPGIDLSQEQDVDFYGRMKKWFESRVTSLLTHLDAPGTTSCFTVLIVAGDVHFFMAPGKFETTIHIDPSEDLRIKEGYESDL